MTGVRRFAFEAVAPTGRRIGGVEEAGSAEALERQIRSRGLLPLKIAPAGERRAPAAAIPWRGRGRATDAFRYLATLLASGFTLDHALDTSARLMGGRLASSLGETRRRVQAGSSLAEALAERPDAFPRLAIGMTEAGERSGDLAGALDRLSAQLERERDLRARLFASLLYPAILAVAGGMALVVLVVFVLPRFVTLLDDAGAALPASTAALLATTRFLGRVWPALLAGVGAAVLGTIAYARSDAGRGQISAALLRVPVIAPLRQRLAAARFGRALATLLRAGLPILPALDVAAASLADQAAAGEVERAAERIRVGGRLAPALEDSRAFPPLFVEMVAVGEEGGRLADMLDRAATMAEEELGRRQERLVRMVEPALIVVFGGVVGFVALSLLQAIYGVRLGGL